MVPVELRLSNFLSYGDEPQTLDFSQFHVACLSGNNGQGKSAILDAITWVLWGEARQSAGGHKPDEELLRIGARRMQVELVFDVEDVRYRVMRAYARSSSGKTSKPELEVQVLDLVTGEGRPITSASIRESQMGLNDILGLDYHTFINSAFLLQGRSDEFTKKKPGERKDILGRILNLEKYDKLAVMARDHQRKFVEALEVKKREVERLQLALESEPSWKEASLVVEAALKARQAELDEVRESEAVLVEKMGAMEAQLKASEAMAAAISRVAEQKKIQEEELVDLANKIATARALVSKAEEIETQCKIFNDLVAERESLDASREIYRGFERQIEQKKSDLQQYQQALEQKIHQLELEHRVNQDALKEVEARLVGKEKQEADLIEAKAAQQRVEAAREKLVLRDKLKEEITALEKTVNGRRESVIGQIKSMQDLQSQLKQALLAKPGLFNEKLKYEADVRTLESLHITLEQVTTEGQHFAETIKSLEGAISALLQEEQKVSNQQKQIEDMDTLACPTCGSTLTQAHRIQVSTQLSEQLAGILQDVQKKKDEIDFCAKQRELKRNAFREAKEKAGQLVDAPKKLVQADEQLKLIELKEQELQVLEEKISRLNDQLNHFTYATEEMARIDALKKQLVLLDFSGDQLEKDQFKANQMVRYEEHLRAILHAEGRKEALLTQTKMQREQIAIARAKIDNGETFNNYKNDIAKLETQFASVGFDPQRFEEVRKNIKLLGNAQNQFQDLLNAQQNLADWEAQRGRIEVRIQEMSEEMGTLKKKYEASLEELAGRVDLENQLQLVKAKIAEGNQITRKLQIQSGELAAKLDQAKNDRALLKSSREALKELRSEEAIYSKLRRAFSKNGIPSLIIEQALPEIEDRTNELLNRLAEGKMRVNLETLKDKKTGGTRETLEIIITDEQGVPRSYETFSGGEAFRVNFALRIALSQMLAERNGVRIRTLAIDEGFGTQDEEGIQNLIEALQTIQDDFEKIIVITHLDRLKEAFPVRIEVVKHPVEGSRFTVFQH